MVTASHIASEEETLELLQVNRKSGLLSDVPLQQSEYTLYSTRSQLPALDKEIGNGYYRGYIPTAEGDVYKRQYFFCSHRREANPKEEVIS